VIATSGFLPAVECTKFVFGRGSAPDPARPLQRSPDSLAGIRGPTSKGRESEGKGGERREREGGNASLLQGDRRP